MSYEALHSKKVGVIAGVLSAVLFSVMALFVQMARNDFSTGQLVFARAVFGILIFSWVARRELASLIKIESYQLWLRAFFGGASVACYFLNLRDLSLGTATVMTDLAPIFVALLSITVFGEKLKYRTLSGVVLAFVGVVILSYPTTAHVDSRSLLIGVGGAAMGAFAYISLKRASGRFSSSLVVLVFSFALLLVAFLDRAPLFSLPAKFSVFPLIGVVVTSLIAQILLTVSYRSLSATTASTLGLTAVLWAIVFDVTLQGANVTAGSLIATTVIICGVKLTYGKPSPTIQAT